MTGTLLHHSEIALEDMDDLTLNTLTEEPFATPDKIAECSKILNMHLKWEGLSAVDLAFESRTPEDQAKVQNLVYKLLDKTRTISKKNDDLVDQIQKKKHEVQVTVTREKQVEEKLKRAEAEIGSLQIQLRKLKDAHKDELMHLKSQLRETKSNLTTAKSDSSLNFRRLQQKEQQVHALQDKVKTQLSTPPPNNADNSSTSSLSRHSSGYDQDMERLIAVVESLRSKNKQLELQCRQLELQARATNKGPHAMQRPAIAETQAASRRPHAWVKAAEDLLAACNSSSSSHNTGSSTEKALAAAVSQAVSLVQDLDQNVSLLQRQLGDAESKAATATDRAARASGMQKKSLEATQERLQLQQEATQSAEKRLRQMAADWARERQALIDQFDGDRLQEVAKLQGKIQGLQAQLKEKMEQVLQQELQLGELQAKLECECVKADNMRRVVFASNDQAKTDAVTHMEQAVAKLYEQLSAARKELAEARVSWMFEKADLQEQLDQRKPTSPAVMTNRPDLLTTDARAKSAPRPSVKYGSRASTPNRRTWQIPDQPYQNPNELCRQLQATGVDIFSPGAQSMGSDPAPSPPPTTAHAVQVSQSLPSQPQQSSSAAPARSSLFPDPPSKPLASTLGNQPATAIPDASQGTVQLPEASPVTYMLPIVEENRADGNALNHTQLAEQQPGFNAGVIKGSSMTGQGDMDRTTERGSATGLPAHAQAPSASIETHALPTVFATALPPNVSTATAAPLTSHALPTMSSTVSDVDVMVGAMPHHANPSFNAAPPAAAAAAMPTSSMQLSARLGSLSSTLVQGTSSLSRTSSSGALRVANAAQGVMQGSILKLAATGSRPVYDSQESLQDLETIPKFMHDSQEGFQGLGTIPRFMHDSQDSLQGLVSAGVSGRWELGHMSSSKDWERQGASFRKSMSRASSDSEASFSLFAKQ